MVNLKERTYGCYKWDLIRISCCDALGCITANRGNPKDFVHQAYIREVYALSYPMLGPMQWEKT